MGLLIYLLDLLGTFAFAWYGSHKALNKKADILGICICATLCAVGGGTIRELILNNLPFYFFDYTYIYAILAGVACAILSYNFYHKINKFVLLIDAVGLSTFAFIGANRADTFHLGIFGIIFFATITAVGGGFLVDIALGEKPTILYKDFYATPAIILGLLYALLHPFMKYDFAIFGLILGILFLRIWAIYYNIHLWVPTRRKKVTNVYLKKLNKLLWLYNYANIFKISKRKPDPEE